MYPRTTSNWYVLATSKDVDAHGTFELTVASGAVNSAEPPPAGAEEKAEAVLADVMRKHLR